MKKLMALLSVIAMLLLAACGGNQGASTSTGSGDGDEKVIEMWHIETGEREALFEEVAKQFEEENDGVKVKLLQAPNDAYKQKLAVSMSGGNPPDIFQSWGGGWLKHFVDQGNVEDITANVDQDHYLEMALNNGTFDDKVYGVPMGLSLDVIFYNKKIFEKYNLEEPKTYEEFTNVIKTLNENDVTPLALTNKTKWPGAYYLMNFASRIGGPDLFESAFNRDGRGFDDPAYVQAGEYIQELVEMDAFNKGFNGIPYDEGRGRQLMYSGQAAMMDMTISFLNNVREEAPDFEEKLGFFVFPTIPGGEGNQTQVGGATGPVWSVASESEHPELAAEFIKALTTKETSQKFTDRTGTLTAVKGVVPKDDFVKEFYEVAQNASHIQMPYDQTLPPELAELHKDTTQALFGLSMTPEEAAKKMEAKAEELLE
ncbi:ABC transporter substrate-binding protein [Guptibacillus hwajinpoensis]|uniref:Raffinose/stachyose/melibiose transport system substrate-binding protein n=1 Tax=Guptibacillus hwajinpoensis TaxID=208199 RepID=A0ABU0K2U2_9BACL|nr:extracellular solute-binding protein [Alkalihalobacillus hemicentroti]MDQ0482472.1 raffinose/stachyose/melibiose transport system substrate-binding protein [Alkalihalobacillus hemicentroti]